MTLGMPSLFPPRGELVNYDYFDISNGAGYDVYYGYQANSGDFKVATSTGIHSEGIYSDVPFSDIDFDILFNTPRTIKGDLIVSIPIAYSRTGSAGNGTITSVITIYHVDIGNNETSLGAETSAVTLFADNSPVIYGIGANNGTINVTQTHFKKGEKLRINISTTTSDNIAKVGHDPFNQDPNSPTAGGYQGSSRMMFAIPFKLDI